MRTTGIIFREFRIGKNMSLDYVTKNIMSTSQLSKFERNEVDITCEKLFKIIEKTNISLDEFVLAKNEFELSRLEKTMQNAKKFYKENKVKQLRVLLQSEVELYQKNLDTNSFFNIVCIKGYLYTLEKSEADFPTKNETTQLIEYLFSVDDWCYYEILLFSNCLQILSPKTTILFAKEIVQKTFFYKEIPKYKRMIIDILITVFIISSEQALFKDALYFKKNITHLLEDETHLYERNIFIFAKGIYYYKAGQESHGVDLMEASIKTFHSLHCDKIVEYYKQYLEQLKKHTDFLI